ATIIMKTITIPSNMFSSSGSKVDTDSKPQANAAARTGAAQPRDRAIRAQLRTGFLRNHFRGPRLRRNEHGCRLRWVPEPVSPLEIRHGIRAPQQELRLRPAQDLRNGH